MLSVDLPVSLKVSLRTSAFNRLMPLNEASCAVLVLGALLPLYWLTRLARMACEAESATGADGVTALNALPVPAGVPEMAPTVEDTGSLVVMMLILPVELSTEACRLFAARAALSWVSVETWP